MEIRNTTDRARAGFTLAEVLIVLVVVAFMAGVAIPQIAGSSDQAILDGAALRARAALLYAQGRSIGGVRHKVVFSPSTETFTVYNVVTGAVAPDPENSAKSYQVVLSADEDLRGVDLASTTFGSNEVSFNDYGVPSGGGTATFSRAGRSRKVSVDAFTGRVSLQ